MFHLDVETFMCGELFLDIVMVGQRGVLSLYFERLEDMLRSGWRNFRGRRG